MSAPRTLASEIVRANVIAGEPLTNEYLLARQVLDLERELTAAKRESSNYKAVHCICVFDSDTSDEPTSVCGFHAEMQKELTAAKKLTHEHRSEFLGAIQQRLMEQGYEPPLWPDVEDDVDSAATMIKELLDRIAELEASQSVQNEIATLRLRLAVAERERDELREELSDAAEVVAFYADWQTWFGVALIGDPPCGAIVDDFDIAENDPNGLSRPGKRARDVLRKYAAPVRKGEEK